MHGGTVTIWSEECTNRSQLRCNGKSRVQSTVTIWSEEWVLKKVKMRFRGMGLTTDRKSAYPEELVAVH